jgi:ubiquinone/menaquinone biosynthesis C-methylase UbiE
METREHAAQRIFGERSGFYAKSVVHKDPEVLRRIIKLATPTPESFGLDVATGSGHTAAALAPHVVGVVCVDITRQMITEAEKLAFELGLVNVQFCLANAHALPFQDRAFDIVTCRRAAHHFSDITQALREMKRVLRSNGKLVLDDRSVPEDDFADSCMNELDRLHDESHVREYRPSEWRRLLEGCGLAVDLVEPYSKHLPLTSLTTNVSRKNAGKIHSIVKGLTDEQRKTMNVTETDGKTYLNHWYVMLSAHLAPRDPSGLVLK